MLNSSRNVNKLSLLIIRGKAFIHLEKYSEAEESFRLAFKIKPSLNLLKVISKLKEMRIVLKSSEIINEVDYEVKVKRLLSKSFFRKIIKILYHNTLEFIIRNKFLLLALLCILFIRTRNEIASSLFNVVKITKFNF